MLADLVMFFFMRINNDTDKTDKCVISNQVTSKNHVIYVKRPVHLMRCYIKRAARCCRYYGAKAQQV